MVSRAGVGVVFSFSLGGRMGEVWRQLGADVLGATDPCIYKRWRR